MKWKKKRRILQVIKTIKNTVKKEGSYSCQVAEIYDSSLRQRTHSFSWWDTTWSKEQILSIRYLRTKGYKVETSAQWANCPSYFKGESFYNNTTRISVYKEYEDVDSKSRIGRLEVIPN